jgi:SPX domain protein involved in polyphosphate accumulation
MSRDVVTDAFRYERKYLTDRLSADQVANFLLLSPAVFQSIYYPRRVWSVYFDTPEFEYYQQNSLGFQFRKKIRIRWYEHDGETTAAQLEMKMKDGEMVQKTVLPLQTVGGTGTLADITAAVQKTLQKHFPEASALQPVLVNSYKRQYFLAEALGIRATVDTDISFSTPADWERAQSTARLPLTILECKYLKENDPKLEQVMQKIPLHITKSSKYIMGIQQCYPYLMS